MAHSVPIDTREITITPVFKHITVEDIPESERRQRQVMKTMEVVEVRFAASKLYSPVFPTMAMWKRDGHKIVTYAERWPEQYRAFLSGDDQRAAGTPLEMMRPYGISDSQLSLCRALRIYSIEALHHLEGPNLKNLQMNANPLKEMARKYMADRMSGSAKASEIDELREEIERLKKAQVLPQQEPTPDEVEAAIAKANAEMASLSDSELKAIIKAKSGQAPRGTPSREFLENAVRELTAS